MQLIIIVAIAAIILFIFLYTPNTVTSHWQHFFDGLQFSADEFYKQVTDGLNERKITGITLDKESFLQSHLFSDRRVYLRITQHEYIFYVCAAPFATGMFVSWWLCIEDEGIIERIPVLSRLLGKDRKNKTFYQMDTEAMYKSAIHTIVTNTAEDIASTNGVKGLSDFERQFK